MQNCERWTYWVEQEEGIEELRNYVVRFSGVGSHLCCSVAEGLLETVMRCPISLTLASISLRAELRAVCIVSESRTWLENARITTKTNDVMRLCSCRTCQKIS